MQRFITFETVSETIDPDMEQSVAKPLFADIVDVLTKNGADLVGSSEQWDSYGWYADFKVGSARLTCMIQRSDNWLMLIDSNRSLMDRLKGRKYETELNELASLAVTAIQEAAGVPVRLYNSEAEFRAG